MLCISIGDILTQCIYDRSFYSIYWRYTNHLTLKMTSAQVVEMSVNVISNSPSQDYTHPDDRTLLYDMTPGFKPFTMLCVVACCCDLLEVVGWSLKLAKLHPKTSNKSQQHATAHNMVCKRSQHLGPNNVASICMGLYSSKFSFDISISASTRNTKTFVLLVLTLSACVVRVFTAACLC